MVPGASDSDFGYVRLDVFRYVHMCLMSGMVCCRVESVRQSETRFLWKATLREPLARMAGW
jgi:hypothetical protein